MLEQRERMLRKILRSSSNSNVSVASLVDAADDDFERDEIFEIQKLSAKDTRRIRVWRLTLTALLLTAALTVILASYNFLAEEEFSKFEIAFSQFSRTVGAAALAQQRDVRSAFIGIANAVSESALATGGVWPTYNMQRFETYARIFRGEHAGIEFLNVVNVVKNIDRGPYIAWANVTFESMVQESHTIETGIPADLDLTTYSPFIIGGGSSPDVDDRSEYYAAWSYSPPPSSYGLVNFNLAIVPDYAAAMQALSVLKTETIVTRVRPYARAVGTAMTKEEHDALHTKLADDSNSEHPHSIFFQPVLRDSTDAESDVVAVIGGGVAWDAALLNLLPKGVTGIHAIIRNNCNQSFTYEIEGPEAYYIGEGDLHEAAYDGYQVTVDLALHSHSDFISTPGHCQFFMQIYPTEEFENLYNSKAPEVFASIVAATFVSIIVAFFVYDVLVQKRNQNLISNAAKSNAIVSSMFPSAIRDKVLFRSYNIQNDDDVVADFYVGTTVLFADICGFTAWSSSREPKQVFTLLETIYSAFDEVAKQRRIFKVETIGDCYVAVAGLPAPRKDHAVVMARFASDILKTMNTLTNDLEVKLGPDTGDLGLRVGINSGPVTAGVLRGERSRFQLFGDTVNTASRMESTGRFNMIQVSQDTADLLFLAGKSAWLQIREDLVAAKGKGFMQTYWLKLSTSTTKDGVEVDSTGRKIESIFVEDGQNVDNRVNRLIEWNVDMLSTSIRQILGQRKANALKNRASRPFDESSVIKSDPHSLLDEVQEIIVLPKNENYIVDDIDLPQGVVDQLREFVSCIATMYRENSFHNFEHASHVNMSVLKLLSRIVHPASKTNQGTDTSASTAFDLQDNTSYGITSDPLTHFACSFSALIHDVDHLGITNAQLVAEGSDLATQYNNRSVAEQNSLELSWKLLMEPRFAELRAALYSTPAEMKRFRQLVVNIVMATDIVDKDLKQLRNTRWDKAFKDYDSGESPRVTINRKATIVLEHLIQASDVSHTMQHWHVYRKWNEKFFVECYKAYKTGRADTDPSENWYKGEIGFFDFYIIPLAKKLKDCGVFGKSSDEFLNYAETNRKEWIDRGQEVVNSMLEKVTNEDFTTQEVVSTRFEM